MLPKNLESDILYGNGAYYKNPTQSLCCHGCIFTTPVQKWLCIMTSSQHRVQKWLCIMRMPPIIIKSLESPLQHSMFNVQCTDGTSRRTYVGTYVGMYVRFYLSHAEIRPTRQDWYAVSVHKNRISGGMWLHQRCYCLYLASKNGANGTGVFSGIPIF